MPGLSLGLASEAQWEYACRLGTTSPYSFGERISKRQVCYESRAPVAVANLPANRWGMHEMHGDVWECARMPGMTLNGLPVDGAPPRVASSGASRRVLRGGSWLEDAGRILQVREC